LLFSYSATQPHVWNKTHPTATAAVMTVLMVLCSRKLRRSYLAMSRPSQCRISIWSRWDDDTLTMLNS